MTIYNDFSFSYFWLMFKLVALNKRGFVPNSKLTKYMLIAEITTFNDLSKNRVFYFCARLLRSLTIRQPFIKIKIRN